MKRKGDHFPFVLVHQGMHPFLAKLQAILEVCELGNKSELQSFLVSLYPDYVNIGESTEPINVKGLSVVLEKGVPSFISSSQRHTRFIKCTCSLQSQAGSSAGSTRVTRSTITSHITYDGVDVPQLAHLQANMLVSIVSLVVQ